MTRYGKVRSLLATARIANVPSVVSNVWVGVAICAAFRRWEHPGFLWTDALWVMLAGVCLYISGNFLNDWHDRKWDARHRPERALPSGLFPPSAYAFISILLALLGVAFSALASLPSAVTALAILFCIVIYTRWHKKAVWTVVPMGLCRALLPVMGFLALPTLPAGAPLHDHTSPAGSLEFDERWILAFHSAALFLYIAALSLGARYESAPVPSRPALLGSKAGLVFSGLLAAAIWSSLSPASALLGLLPFALWLTLCLTKHRRPIPVHVSALLAGIPLLDGVALFTYSRLEPAASYPPALQPYLMACTLIPILAFAAGRLLQRLAPAT